MKIYYSVLFKFVPHVSFVIIYFTVYEEDGLAYFKNDIYLYDQIIQESVEGHKKKYFKVPKKRMVSIKKKSQLPKKKR